MKRWAAWGGTMLLCTLAAMALACTGSFSSKPAGEGVKACASVCGSEARWDGERCACVVLEWIEPPVVAP